MKSNQVRAAAAIVVLLLLLATIIAVLSFSSKQRVFTQKPEKHLTVTSEDAAKYWDKAGVKGRILVYLTPKLDNGTPRFQPTTSMEANFTNMNKLFDTSRYRLGNADFVHWNIMRQVLRKAIFVVPDTIWQKDKNHYKEQLPFASWSGNTIKGNQPEGTPVDIVSLSEFQPPHEKVLLIVDANFFKGGLTGKELVRILKKKIDADIVVFTEGRGEMPPKEWVEEAHEAYKHW